MMAITKFLAGGVAIAALASAAPAAAQYYPGYGSPYGYGYPGYGGGNTVGQVINQVLGGGYGYNGYGYNGAGNSQAAVSQCVGAVQARLNGGGYGGYGYNGYGSNGAYGGGRVLGISRVEPRSNGGLTVRGVANSGRYAGAYGYNGYGNNGAYGGGRVLGISRVEPRSNGGLTVRGVANSGRYAGAYGYNGQGQVDLTFKCKTDYRGFVTNVELQRAQSNYGYNYQPYSNNGYDYSQYGYRRY
jgi:hypothetical protein